MNDSANFKLGGCPACGCSDCVAMSCVRVDFDGLGAAIPTPCGNTPYDEGPFTLMPTKPFQQRVYPWLLVCFGAKIANDRVERNHRFLEESLELVQSLGLTQSEAHQLVDYVFGRPVGYPPQEVGGVMVTLAALCLANGMDMHEAGEVELARIDVPAVIEKIRAKQAAKPNNSPLPEYAQPALPVGSAIDLRSLIEGMSVSVDVSAGHHDEGRRYFGTVTEVMECPEDKHGVTLLVQDAEPNFTPGSQDDALSATRWREWSKVMVAAAASPLDDPLDSPFMLEFSKIVGDASGGFTAEQLNTWVDATIAALNAKGGTI